MTPTLTHSDLSPVVGYLRAILTDMSAVAQIRQLTTHEANTVEFARHIIAVHDAGLPVSLHDIGEAFHNFVKG